MFSKLLHVSRLLLPRMFADTALFASFEDSARQNPEEIAEFDRVLEKRFAEHLARPRPSS
jgi:hypothetical protein